MLWEHTQATSESFHSFFKCFYNFHECFYNLIETWRTCFLFLLENNARKKGKQLPSIVSAHLLSRSQHPWLVFLTFRVTCLMPPVCFKPVCIKGTRWLVWFDTNLQHQKCYSEGRYSHGLLRWAAEFYAAIRKGLQRSVLKTLTNGWPKRPHYMKKSKTTVWQT